MTLIVQRSSFGTDADYVSKRGLVSRFADLFAADNPKRCRDCKRTQATGLKMLCPQDGFGGRHTYVGGFNRAEFLRDCGIKEGE
ncbi:hypothetical protein LCGC14_2725750 [marine sediment metagenome]|uniref:Uncharacterized protein n=1 Tax=marine sediment metagenome TaxID=412755 RepID=A0A0F8Z8Q8_9ZZZZ